MPSARDTRTQPRPCFHIGFVSPFSFRAARPGRAAPRMASFGIVLSVCPPGPRAAPPDGFAWYLLTPCRQAGTRRAPGWLRLVSSYPCATAADLTCPSRPRYADSSR